MNLILISYFSVCVGVGGFGRGGGVQIVILFFLLLYCFNMHLYDVYAVYTINSNEY